MQAGNLNVRAPGAHGVAPQAVPQVVPQDAPAGPRLAAHQAGICRRLTQAVAAGGIGLLGCAALGSSAGAGLALAFCAIFAAYEQAGADAAADTDAQAAATVERMMASWRNTYTDRAQFVENVLYEHDDAAVRPPSEPMLAGLLGSADFLLETAEQIRQAPTPMAGRLDMLLHDIATNVRHAVRDPSPLDLTHKIKLLSADCHFLNLSLRNLRPIYVASRRQHHVIAVDGMLAESTKILQTLGAQYPGHIHVPVLR